MARMGENIYKRKDGRWEGRCIIGHDENGRAFFRYLYGRSYKEVKEKLLIQDKQKQSNDSNLCSMYFGDILDNWLRRKKLSVKESSYGKYLHTVNHYIRPIEVVVTSVVRPLQLSNPMWKNCCPVEGKMGRDYLQKPCRTFSLS